VSEGNLTNRSTSLSGRKSSRTTDPNADSSATFNLRQKSSSRFLEIVIFTESPTSVTLAAKCHFARTESGQQTQVRLAVIALVVARRAAHLEHVIGLEVAVDDAEFVRAFSPRVTCERISAHSTFTLTPSRLDGNCQEGSLLSQFLEFSQARSTA